MNDHSAKYWAIVPAAGIGLRMEQAQPKQYSQIGERTVLEHSLMPLLACSWIECAVVAINPHDKFWCDLPLSSSSRIQTVAGGKERYDSVANSLAYLSSVAANQDWVLVHDCARPCLTVQDLNQLKNQLQNHPTGGILAYPERDTIKRYEKDKIVTEDRRYLWHALTPQMFRFGILQKAMTKVLSDGLIVTDEASALELADYSYQLIEGRTDNIKVTYPQDLALAEHFLAAQNRI